MCSEDLRGRSAEVILGISEEGPETERQKYPLHHRLKFSFSYTQATVAQKY